MKKTIYTLTLLLLIAGLGPAQDLKYCGTTEVMQEAIEKDPQIAIEQEKFEKYIQEQLKSVNKTSSAQIFVIPVVFHIIHNYGAENISDAQVISAITTLNKDFRKLNSDTASIVPCFKNIAADCQIEFRLAQIDPDGNCTNGIDRITSYKTYSATDEAKLNQWPRAKYLNIWVVNSIKRAGVAGYAYFPSAVTGINFPADGIVILHNYVGNSGTSTAFNSRSLTHEVGHYLGLNHPWGSNNDAGQACGDDGISDTPVTKGHLSCNLTDLSHPICSFSPFAGSYTFDSLNVSSGVTDPTPAPVNTYATFGSFSAVGVSANPAAASSFSYSDWGTGAASISGDTTYSLLTGSMNTSKYYEFTVTPAVVGNSMTLTSISFNFKRSTTGVRTYAVCSSLNGYASNLPASISPANTLLKVRSSNVFFSQYDTTANLTGSKITLSASYTDITSPVTFRIYGWNAEDNLGSFSIDNVSITGSAGIIENTQNFMDYSYCCKMFTNVQKTSMQATLGNFTSYRNNLWTAANLIATGTDGTPAQTCVPFSDFSSNRMLICEGDAVSFTDRSFNGTVSNRTWTFNGGNPSTSTIFNPLVTYNNKGVYDVVLNVSNAAGNDTKTKTGFIYVNSVTADFSGYYTEDFENTSQFSSKWILLNKFNNTSTWARTTSAAYNGNASVKLNNYDGDNGDADDLVSPSFDLTGVGALAMSFKISCASTAVNLIDLTDKLEVLTSTDCGKTWIVRYTVTGSSLPNAGYWPGSFTPSSQNDWKHHGVFLPTSLKQSNVRFMFRLTSGGKGNNLYIDNINIGSSITGIDDGTSERLNFSVYPNPVTNSAYISYTLQEKQQLKIELYDLVGRQIAELINEVQLPGEHTLSIENDVIGSLSNGVYLLKFNSETIQDSKKLILNR